MFSNIVHRIFARHGYRFASTPTKPAIQLFRTSLKAVKGTSRGVQATNHFAYLPPGFLIFFSYHACLCKPSVTTPHSERLTGSSPDSVGTSPLGNFKSCRKSQIQNVKT